VQAAALRRADAVIATSRETGEEALAFGVPATRIERLANGVDTNRFYPASSSARLAARTDLGLASAGLVVFVGRLSPEKNPDGLLSAWVKAQPQLPSGWKLVFIGDGPMRQTLKERVEAEALRDSVQFAGERSDVEHWLRAADIYVLASHHEGLSNTTLEAMASGLPVVSTRVSASAETIGEGEAGLIVDVGRMDQLAEALIRLATDSTLRERMGRAGRAVIERKYSIDRVAEAHLELYRRLITTSASYREIA
jgi:glycosyltransferase involved in cell wall biosynthesis